MGLSVRDDPGKELGKTPDQGIGAILAAIAHVAVRREAADQLVLKGRQDAAVVHLAPTGPTSAGDMVSLIGL
jgi:hypothetical protein